MSAEALFLKCVCENGFCSVRVFHGRYFYAVGAEETVVSEKAVDEVVSVDDVDTVTVSQTVSGAAVVGSKTPR